VGHYHGSQGIETRDVPDFGSGSGRSAIRPFLANPAKSGSGQNFGRIWPDLWQLSGLLVVSNDSLEYQTNVGFQPTKPLLVQNINRKRYHVLLTTRVGPKISRLIAL